MNIRNQNALVAAFAWMVGATIMVGDRQFAMAVVFVAAGALVAWDIAR